MTPRHDIPDRRSSGRIDSWQTMLGVRLADPLVSRAVTQMQLLMAQGKLTLADIERFERLRAQADRRRASGRVRIELIKFVGELMARRGPSPGASPMPAPVFPNGGPKPLSGAAEAPLD